MTVQAQLRTAQDSFNTWLTSTNTGEWSLTHLRDVQKESLIWVFISVALVITFWKGVPLPWGAHWERVYRLEHGEYVMVPDGKEDGGEVKGIEWALFLQWVPLLAPIKYQTVLFHEASHAIVGWCSNGRPTCIMITWNEGGVTYFNPQPKAYLTYPAGYICIIGCLCLIAGFDALRSKYAFIVLECLALATTILCFFVIPKSVIHHEWFMICHYFHKHILRDEDKAKDYKARDVDYKKECRKQADEIITGREGEEFSDKDMMSSIEEILFVNIFISAIVGAAWYFDDSVYLRFVILFLGNMNAWYAIFDIYLDGFKYSGIQQSDVTLMAKAFNRKNGKNHTHPTRYYSFIWLSVEVCLFLVAVIVGLYTSRDTIAEQAIHSRTFLPRSQHLGAAELLSQASDSAGD